VSRIAVANEQKREGGPKEYNMRRRRYTLATRAASNLS
jgi:hypothetical protein